MATDKLEIVIDAEDNASDPIDRAGDALNRLRSGIGSLDGALRQYNSMMSVYNHGVVNLVKDMGSAIYDFTTESIQNFTEFSEQHAKTLGALANNYDKTLESQQKFIENSQKLKEQAFDLASYGPNGNGSLSNATQISSLQTELSKAGVSEEDMLNSNVTKTVLQFAQANNLNTSDAVEFAVTLGNQFDIDKKDWGSMLDKVSHTADLSVVDVNDIVASMKYAGGISSGLNRPMDETLGLISTLGNFGLIGSQAGTGIQAFLTRLLTGDTTVITDAQQKVAPKDALEKFYEFSNYAKGGGDLTYDQIMSEDFDNIDVDSDLLPMSQVVDKLNEVMGEMDDEEQAWFAKKLFGLYQMKSAYALIDGDSSGLQSVINEIESGSAGTNENKLNLLLGSQYGQNTSLSMLWSATKTQFGDALSPMVNTIRDELFSFLSNKGNYDINWDNIQRAIDESCGEIEDQFGSAVSDGVRKLAYTTIDLGQIAESIAPEAGEGIIKMISSALDFNFFGKDSVTGDWKGMISNMKLSVEGLPEDMQNLGNAVVDVIDFFGKLTAVNIATQIAQLITSVMQIAMMTIRAANVVVNGTSVTGGTGGTAGGVVAGGALASNSAGKFNIGNNPGLFGIGALGLGIQDASILKNNMNMKDATIGGNMISLPINPKDYNSYDDYVIALNKYNDINGTSYSALNQNNYSRFGGKMPTTYGGVVSEGSELDRLLDMFNGGEYDTSKNIPKNMADLQKQSYINNNGNKSVEFSPKINVQAPTVNVDVKVDKDGNSKTNTSILNPGFDSNINNWYSKKSSQNGSTQK